MHLFEEILHVQVSVLVVWESHLFFPPSLSLIVGLEGIAEGNVHSCIAEKFRKADSKFSA